MDAFDLGWRSWVGGSSFLHHALVHSDPDPFTQSVAALQLKVLADPAGPDSIYILGIECDFERPALEAAGAEEKM